MSDFKQAIKWLKEGKKVKRKNEGWFLKSQKMLNLYKTETGELCSHQEFSIPDFEATDWEIYGDNSMTLKQKEAYDRGFESGRNWDKPDLKKGSLSDGFEHWEKLLRENKEPILIVQEIVKRLKETTKEKIQNAQKRLEKDAKNLDEFDGTYKVASEMMGRYIENIFKEEFGELR